MSPYSFTADQLRALLDLLNMANKLRPEFERALAARSAPAVKAVNTRRGGGDD
jgi:hypothetical protein